MKTRSQVRNLTPRLYASSREYMAPIHPVCTTNFGGSGHPRPNVSLRRSLWSFDSPVRFILRAPRSTFPYAVRSNPDKNVDIPTNAEIQDILCGNIPNFSSIPSYRLWLLSMKYQADSIVACAHYNISSSSHRCSKNGAMMTLVFPHKSSIPCVPCPKGLVC